MTSNSQTSPQSVIDFAPATLLADRDAAMTTRTGTQPVEISVVIPTYRAEGCLDALHKRLTESLQAIGKNYEIIFVEDCGPDNSWAVLKKMADADEHVLAFKLSRNFGQHMAITAGLSKARGNWTIVMDCDGQDPPELIGELYEKALTGHDIVFAKRKQRTHSQLRRLASKTYFALVNMFGVTNAGGHYGSFTIISHKVREAFLKFSDVNRHYLMILVWLGFDIADIEYEQAQRYSGESSYSLYALIRLAVEGVFFQTTSLLKAIVLLGFGVSLAGSILACWEVVEFFYRGAQPGWTSVTVITLLLGGVILISQGIVGLYVGEIFDQVKERPLFVIAQEYHPHLAAAASAVQV